MENLKNVFDLCNQSVDILKGKFQEIILRHGRQIDRVMDLFSDDESRFLYAQEIVYCALYHYLQPDLAPYFSGLMTGKEFQVYVNEMKENAVYPLFDFPEQENAELIKAIDMTATFILDQYSYKDLVKVEDGDICFDGGAFIGDTSVYFAQLGAKKVYAFEIDHRNLKSLKNNVKNFNKSNVVEIEEKALGNRNGTMNYVPMQGNISGGHISDNESGVYTIDVTTIDTFCLEKNIVPDFIKLDIEGAELDAVYGAKKILKKRRPKLAICIYHKLHHRWDIPLLLHDFVPEYKFYLKKSQPHTETVLFAI